MTPRVRRNGMSRIAEVLKEGNARKNSLAADKMGVALYDEIREKFMYAMENDISILIENVELSLTQAVVIKLDYVGERWCKGIATYHRRDGDVKVPYTIHYSEMFIRTGSQVKSANIVFKGDNPYG